MYGVPKDLPLDRFVSRPLNQIALGRFQTQLHFAGCGSIFIEGPWELRDPNGSLIDHWQDHETRGCYRIHRILDLPVSRFEIDAPASFTLIFEPSFRLTVFDDSKQHESFSVNVKGMPSFYV
jgi:uncharacterized protein YceK